jgi:hypothetical protein
MDGPKIILAEEGSHVFQHDVARSKKVGNPQNLPPKRASSSALDSTSFPRARYVLARETARERFNRTEVIGSDPSDVFVPLRLREVPFENSSGVFVTFHLP